MDNHLWPWPGIAFEAATARGLKPRVLPTGLAPSITRTNAAGRARARPASIDPNRAHRPMHDAPSPTHTHVAFLALASEGGVGLLALFLSWLLGYPLHDALRWETAAWVWGTLAVVPLLGIMAMVLWAPWPPFRRLVAALDELVIPLFRTCNLADLALISALAGLGEEMLFRGVIQRVLADLGGESIGPWLGLVAASLLFGLAHAITRAYVGMSAIIGAYLGLLWMATENLLVPIVAHALYDFLALVYLVRIRNAPTS